MSLAEKVFGLADEMVVDLKVDICQRFVLQRIRTMLTEDPELSYSVPFRMFWYYMYVKTEQEVSRGEQWKTDQHLCNANHYCANTAMLYHDGSYAFMCWLLYGLSLFDCGQYATAEVILKMEHMKSTFDHGKSTVKQDCSGLHT